MAVELQATVAVDLSGLEEFRVAIESQLNHQQTGPITKAFNQWIARYRSFIKERYDKFSRGGGNWPPLSDKTKWKRRSGKGKKSPRKPRGPKIKQLKTGEIIKSNVRTRKGVSANVVKAGKRKSQISSLNKRIAKIGTQKKFKGLAGKFRGFMEKRKLKAKIGKLKSGSQKSKLKSILKANKKARDAFKKAKKNYLKKGKFSILRDTGTLFAAVSPTVADKPGAVSAAIPFGMRVGYGGASRHPKAKATIADIAAFHQTGAGFLPKREIIVRPDAETGAAMTRYMMKAIAELTKGGDEQVSQQ